MNSKDGVSQGTSEANYCNIKLMLAGFNNMEKLITKTSLLCMFILVTGLVPQIAKPKLLPTNQGHAV